MPGKFEFLYNLDGSNNVPTKFKLPVAASQSLLAGDAVIISGGLVTKAGAAFGRCLGVMAQDSASAAADTLVEVYVSQPGQVWRATASASATSAVRASRAYDLIVTTQLVDPADTTGGCVYILKTDSSSTDIHVLFTAHELA